PLFDQNLVQINLDINDSTAVLYAGQLLPLLFQQNEPKPSALAGLPAFALKQEETDADAAAIAAGRMTPRGTLQAWWLNDDKTAFIARDAQNFCIGGCPVKIFIKRGEEWRAVLASALDAIWIDGDRIAEPGSRVYTG